MPIVTSINLSLGEDGKSFSQRYPGRVVVNRQPAGLDFYDVRWLDGAQGSAVVQNGRYTFSIENVLGVTGFQNIDFPAEGIPQFDVSASLSDEEMIPHDDARKKMFNILQKIQQIGWRNTILRSRPRIRGKDMFDYLIKAKRYTTLDASYVPTLNEWMELENQTTWSFYADHVFLDVSFMRDLRMTDLAKPGVYLVNFLLKSEAEHFRGEVESAERKRWKEFLPGRLAKLVPIRAEEEVRLRAQGVKIDEAYFDPIF